MRADNCLQPHTFINLYFDNFKQTLNLKKILNANLRLFYKFKLLNIN
jgi:hypothetical protein